VALLDLSLNLDASTAFDLFQPMGATPMESGSTEMGGGDAGGGGFFGGGACDPSSLGMIAVMVIAFYFLLIRPQQKKAKEHDAMLKSLRPGTVVRTSGGIRGEIVGGDEQEVTLLIAPKVKVQVARAHIAQVIMGGGEPSKDSTKKDGDGEKSPKDDSSSSAKDSKLKDAAKPDGSASVNGKG
jgi:preprotein translocase subunit YajC